MLISELLVAAGAPQMNAGVPRSGASLDMRITTFTL
jgi:hypothetical protein